MDADRFLSSFVRQYLFFSLYWTFAESLANENASRLMDMQMPRGIIEEHLNELTVQFNRERQEAISEELWDMVTGIKALTRGVERVSTSDFIKYTQLQFIYHNT